MARRAPADAADTAEATDTATRTGKLYAQLSWDVVQAIMRGERHGELPEDFNGPGYPPVEPCPYRPGTEEKITMLAGRYARRETLFHRHDAR